MHRHILSKIQDCMPKLQLHEWTPITGAAQKDFLNVKIASVIALEVVQRIRFIPFPFPLPN